jgi:hypothetical protein
MLFEIKNNIKLNKLHKHLSDNYKIEKLLHKNSKNHTTRVYRQYGFMM